MSLPVQLSAGDRKRAMPCEYGLIVTVRGGEKRTSISSARLAVDGLRVHQIGKGRGMHSLRIDALSEEHLAWAWDHVHDHFGKRLVACMDLTMGVHAGGLLRVEPTIPIETREELAIVYTPGVGRVATRIAAEPKSVDQFTAHARTVAVISDGTDVPLVGEAGVGGGLVLAESCAAVISGVGSLNAVPLALRRSGVDGFVDTVAAVAPSFSGVLLTGVAAPRCFELADRLRQRVALPVLVEGDGFAVAIAAGLLNALIVLDLPMRHARVVIRGLDGAAFALAELLATQFGADVVVVDAGRIVGPLARGDRRSRLAAITNPRRLRSAREALADADAFVDLGGTRDHLPTAANPQTPVVFLVGRSPTLHELEELGTPAILATPSAGGINSPLATPGLLLGQLQTREARLQMGGLGAAARAIARLVEPTAACLVPAPLDPEVAAAVATSVITYGAAPGPDGCPTLMPPTDTDRAPSDANPEESEHR